jgi:pimeloyl-ACP methyl ester carboxylesterase
MTSTSLPIRERVVAIGPDENVIGILTEAVANAGDLPQGVLPNVVFLNAGVLHRVGPHRLHVILAHLLAGMGYRCLRIDLSGIGDSRNLPGTLTFRQSSVADARAAMDFLETQGGKAPAIFFGLCSGADNGLATARADDRVAGIVLIDPPSYTTIRSQMRAIVGKLANCDGGLGRMATWAAGLLARTVRWCLRALRERLAAKASGGARPPSGRTPPPANEYARQVTALLDRGVKILCIFSGGNGARYNHPNQMFESFPRLRGRLEVVYFPAANHVFTELKARDALIDTVSRWCRKNFS